jgi:hypothetical protein
MAASARTLSTCGAVAAARTITHTTSRASTSPIYGTRYSTVATTHDKLIKEAEAAISRLHADTSVSREQTLDSLENVRELVLDLIRDLKG